MAIQLSVPVRNARLDAIETAVGTSAIMRIYSGAAPAATSTAASGTLLAEIALPADWMAAASNGQKAKLGTWTDASANAAGTAGYFRVLESTGTTAHIQGTITATGGGGDMEVDNTSFAAGQEFTITTFTLNEPNA